MIYLRNVIKAFVYFNIAIARKGAFKDIFTYCNVRKSIVFFNPSISNHMSLIAISVDHSVRAGGRDLPLIIIVNNSINKITSEGKRNFPLWFLIV